MRNKFLGIIREQRFTTPIPAEKMVVKGSQIVIKRVSTRSYQPFECYRLISGNPFKMMNKCSVLLNRRWSESIGQYIHLTENIRCKYVYYVHPFSDWPTLSWQFMEGETHGYLTGNKVMWTHFVPKSFTSHDHARKYSLNSTEYLHT